MTKSKKAARAPKKPAGLYHEVLRFKNVVEYHLDVKKSEEVPKGTTYYQTVQRHKEMVALTRMFNQLCKMEEMFAEDNQPDLVYDVAID